MCRPQTGRNGMMNGRMKMAMKLKLAAIAPLVARPASFQTFHQATAHTTATIAEKIGPPRTPICFGNAEFLALRKRMPWNRYVIELTKNTHAIKLL